MFKMNNDVSISIIYTRFTNIIYNLTTLGKVYSNEEIVRKIFNSANILGIKSEQTILEVRDFKKLEVNEFIESLIIYKYTLKRGEDEGKLKKGLTLKAILHERENDENEKSDEKNKKVSMIIKRIKRFLKRNKIFMKICQNIF
ncbi:hypothetical protein CIPAW_16G057200 [Carya illinoinensis]|uniref:Uncharacterized protein n=1 Tax=Carya illinoinensis TaxID=32201 RepID=A0A8T1N237_CARIL|nr:hypothetical protein CIPAW_16G057200 [Carya illinoinensis]